MRRNALPLVALLLAGACGPAAPPPAEPLVVATAAPTATAAPALPPAPTRIEAGAVPADADLYVEVTGLPEILTAVQKLLGGKSLDEARAALAREAGVEPALAIRLIDALSTAHLGGKRAGDDFKAGVGLVFSDGQPVRDLIAAGPLTDAGPFGPYGRRLKAPGSGKDAIAWFDGPRLLVWGDEPFAQSMAAVVEGRARPLATASLASTQPAGGQRNALAYVAPAMLDTLAEGKVSFPAPLTAAYGLWEGGFRGAMRAALTPRDVPTDLPLPPPRTLDVARRLPAETVSYLALSLALPDGRAGVGRLLGQVGSLDMEARRAISGLDAALAEVGLHLADVIGSLGTEGVISVSVRPGVKTKEDVEKNLAVIVALDLADPDPADRLLKEALAKAKTRPKKVKVKAEKGGFSAELLDGAPLPFARAQRVGKDRVFLGIGQRDLVDKALLALDKGKGTLGDDAAHARLRRVLPERSQARLWIDLGRAVELAGASQKVPAAALELWRGAAQGPGRVTSGLSLSVIPEPDRLRVELDEANGLGLLAAVGVFGARSYLAHAKSAEAKNTIGAIYRSAVAAYERESLGGNGAQPVHALCGTAVPVPHAVPKGKKVQSSSAAGQDWQTGNAQRGWTCLKFLMSEPQYYQYTYIAGGNYKGPPRGGPDPGPHGFEVAAEGDLDGDGVTSLFTLAGVVDPQTGAVEKIAPLWIDKEEE